MARPLLSAQLNGLEASHPRPLLQVCFVVMGNLFHSTVQLHSRFDLKGSRLGRTAGHVAHDDPHAIFKVRTTMRLSRGAGGLSLECGGVV